MLLTRQFDSPLGLDLRAALSPWSQVIEGRKTDREDAHTDKMEGWMDGWMDREREREKKERERERERETTRHGESRKLRTRP